MFKGCATAIITPFREDGEIDEEGLRELVRMQERAGVDAIVPCGTTGESATLSHKEHLKVIGIVREEAKRAKVIAGAGSNATHEAIHLSKGAKDLGVDGVLLISPYYNKPNQKGIFRHYEAIAKAVDVPIVVYNVPSRTGSNIAAGTIKRLSEVPNIVAVKEASGNMEEIGKIIAGARKGFIVWSGNDADTLPMMSIGGYGIISVASHLVGLQMKEMMNNFLAGKTSEAAAIHLNLMPLMKVLFIVSNPVPVKYALNQIGFNVGKPRLPLVEPDAKAAAQIKEVLKNYKIDLPLE